MKAKRTKRPPPTAGKALNVMARLIDGAPPEHAYPEPPKPRAPGSSYIEREPTEQPQRVAAQLPMGVTGRILRRR